MANAAVLTPQGVEHLLKIQKVLFNSIQSVADGNPYSQHLAEPHNLCYYPEVAAG